MPEPRIKKEQSEEPPLSAMPSKRGGTKETLLFASSDRCDKDNDADLAQRMPALRSQPPEDLHDTHKQLASVKVKRESIDINVAAAMPAPATHRAILPRRWLDGARHVSGPRGFHLVQFVPSNTTTNSSTQQNRDATTFWKVLTRVRSRFWSLAIHHARVHEPLCVQARWIHVILTTATRWCQSSTMTRSVRTIPAYAAHAHAQCLKFRELTKSRSDD